MGMHPQMLKEQAAFERSLIVFERLWEISEGQKKVNVTTIPWTGKDLRNYRLVTLSFISGKVMEQTVLETIFKQWRTKRF